MSYWNDDVDIDVQVEVEDIIDDIPTETLEEELEKRKEKQEKDPDGFKRDERFRYNTLSVTIDPSDYDLIKRDDVGPEDLSIVDMVTYLDRHGYSVLYGHDIINLDAAATRISDLPKYKFRDLMCDVLCLGRCVSNEEIINEFKTKL